MATKSLNLQTLRGISVLTVIFFHSGLALFRNGWVGVDIFFVISGYLMWSIYAQKIRDGQIKYFYKKRLIRLLPALSMLILITPVFLMIKSTPGERIDLTSELLMAALGTSNVYYWLDVQYFASTQLKPYLNLWSIALELQFYLLFPLIVFFLGHSRKRLISLTIASFSIFLFASFISPQSAFYLLPGRLWQFLAGAVMASFSSKLQAGKSIFLFSKYALYFFLVALLFVPDANLNRVIVQLLAVGISSVFVITGAQQCQGSAFDRTLAKIGDYSYSLYLIHFPLFVFMGYSRFEGNPLELESLASVILWFFLLTILSLLFKKFVEDNQNLKSNFVVLHLLTLILVSAVYANRIYISQLGYSPSEVAISNATSDRGVFRCGFWARVDFLNSPTKTCLLSEKDGKKPKILLVGNSHADSIKEAVVRALSTAEVYLLNENNPLNEKSFSNYLEGVRELKPNGVIVHSSYGSNNLEYLERFIKNTKALGVQVTVIEPIPQPRFNVPEFAWELNSAGRNYLSLRLPEFSLESYRRDKIVELEAFKRLKGVYGIKLISVASHFCKPYCQIADEQSGRLYYFDNTHLTLTGAENIHEALVKARLDVEVK